ncbi:MAG TPA: hypothetical protein VGN34_07855, partial [Ktedonobacteraceae bacterium]
MNGFVFGQPEAYLADEVAEWSINHELGRYMKLTSTERERRLITAGLLASFGSSRPSNQRTYKRRFMVSVFHLRALRAIPLGRSGIVRSPGLGPEQGTPLWRRLEKTAIRALYAFGLDMGDVIIDAGEEGLYTVKEVSPTPDFTDVATAQLYADAMAEHLGRLDQFSSEEAEVLIGMDPEFLLFNRSSGKVVPASRFLSHHGEAGCDVLRFQGRRLLPLAELRPAPGREPDEIVRHLLHAFRTANTYISDRNLLWQAGGMPQRGFPLGGHVHFSGIPLTSELLRVLDNYLALPVFMLEDSRSFRRRPNYGFLGDYRIKSYGGFEYRTLPSFLISPLVTKGVIALAKLIVEDPGHFKRRPMQDDEVFRAFYGGHPERIRQFILPLLSDIVQSDGYSRYEKYLDPFLEAVKLGLTWDESTDIRGPWKIQNHS